LFADTATVTCASPWPALGLSCTHGASVLTVQEHSRAADTVACTLVPAAGNEAGNPFRLVAHFTALGAVVVLTELPPHPAATHARAHPKTRRTMEGTQALLACD
jgi:hypothetical protein